jgi:hypothetical protein
MSSAEEIKRAFRNRVKECKCPHCEMEFTDAAVDWGDAWYEGYRDSFRLRGSDIRDGPCKLRCELCGGRSWYDIFGGRVTPAEKA